MRSALDPKGTVFVEGETWNAVIEEGRAGAGEEVVVKGVDGLRLNVVKKSKYEVRGHAVCHPHNHSSRINYFCQLGIQKGQKIKKRF